MATQLTQVTFPTGDYIKDTKAWSDITGKPSAFTPSAHTHYELATIGDQRSTATTPNTYANRLIFQGLKTQGTIGNPGGTSGYSYLLGLRGWADPSGGNSHEIAFNNNGVYLRNGATTAWGNWSKIFTSSDTYSGTLTSSQVTTALGYTPPHEPVKDIPATPASIATFSDGSPLPMPKLEIAVEPQQDLHGYDYPWVGGSGKNKFPIATATSSGTQNIFSAQTISLKANTNYVLSFNSATPTTKDMSLSFNNGNTQVRGITISAGVTSVNLTFSQNIDNIDWYVREAVNLSNIMVEEGSTKTAFAPYSNICPISGWSAVDVTKTGKNLWGGEKLANDIVAKVPQATKDTTNKTVTYYASQIAGITLFNKFKENTRYTFYFSTSSSYTNMMVRYTDGTYDGIEPNTYKVTYANKTVSEIRGAWASGTTVLKYDECGIFEGVITAQDFEPYNPNSETITIQLGDTYYGGKLDVVSGVLTVDRVGVDMGDLTWTYYSIAQGSLFRSDITNMKPTSNTLLANCICSQYSVVTQDNRTNGTISSAYNTTLIDVVDNRYSDASTFKTAMNGVQLVYELATPLTIQLTPTVVSSLEGNNNISANCGNVLNGKYVMQDYSDITSKVSDFAQLASKLGSSNVGSATQPIYLNAGSPAACTYTLGKSVPSDAVFTDTKVTQTPTTTNATYELLFSGSADNTERTESARKSQYATFNPSKQAFTFGTRLTGSTVGEYSYAEGENVTASGDYSHAEGRNTVASNDRSHAEGNYTTASGFASHAEGQTTYASDSNSHAEGSSTTASGYASHSEGYKTIASDNRSHAEGSYTTASGYASHAEGEYTIANHTSQHVFGQYNIPDPSTASSDSRGNYVEIVGNGTVGTPSTARTLDWDGNETLAGSLNINGGNVNLGTSSSSSDDSGDIAFFYGNGQEKARIFSANEFTSYDDLNYRCYKKDGTLLGNSHLATRKDIVPISGGKAITTSTSMSYTGLSFVVPPRSVVSVTVRAVWQNGWPKIIGVSTSSSSQGSSLIASNVQYSGVGHLSTAVNYFNSSSSNLTLYIWAQYSSASSNTINYWGYSQRYDT